MNQEWDGKHLDDLICLDPTGQDEGLSIWSFLEHMSEGRLLRVTNAEAFSLALDEVFLEMYHNVLKRVSPRRPLSGLSFCLCPSSFTLAPPLQGYMWKKGHVRRNWTERWFVLKPSSIEYFVSEDLKDKRGEAKLDKNCVVEVGKGMESTVFVTTRIKMDLSACFLFLRQPVSDRDGKRCMFCVKTHNKTFEISASDQKQKVEWIQGSFQSNRKRISLLLYATWVELILLMWWCVSAGTVIP